MALKRHIKLAIVRGSFLNAFEMQFFEPLAAEFDITAFSSLKPFHDRFSFPVIHLPSPMDLPEFPLKMPILNRMFTDAHYLFGLEKHLSGFDIVHTAETYYRFTQQALNARARGSIKKVVATVLETIPFNNEGIHGRYAYKARARMELDHMIALTRKAKRALMDEGADSEKISVISHYVDTKRFVPNPRRQEEIADPQTRNLTILFCGRMEGYKGIFEILDAAEYLVANLKEYVLTFVFAGSGSKNWEFDKRVRQYGLHHHIQRIQSSYDAMPGVYKKAHIYIAPSKPTTTWEEQYNTTLLEAQAMGLPIVTTSSGGIPENVGDCALLSAPGDVSALTGNLKRFILDSTLRAAYAKKARLRAEHVHDIRIGARKLSALYRLVLTQ